MNNKRKYFENNFTPYDYQIDAFNAFKNNFNGRGILSLPPNTGKTFILYLCSTLYKQIIIVSPLKKDAVINLNKFINYGYDNKNLLLDSYEECNDFIKNNCSFLISSSYCQINIINKIQNTFN